MMYGAWASSHGEISERCGTRTKVKKVVFQRFRFESSGERIGVLFVAFPDAGQIPRRRVGGFGDCCVLILRLTQMMSSWREDR